MIGLVAIGQVVGDPANKWGWSLEVKKYLALLMLTQVQQLQLQHTSQ